MTSRFPNRRRSSRRRSGLARQLCFVVGNGRVCAEGKWQRNGPWEGTVAGYEIPLAIVLPPSGEDSGICRPHRRTRARFGRAGPAAARRSRHAHHRRRDHLSSARRGAANTQSRHGRSGSHSDARAHRFLVRRAGVHGYVSLRQRAPATRRRQRHHEDAADRRHARAGCRREHPAAGVSGGRSRGRTSHRARRTSPARWPNRRSTAASRSSAASSTRIAPTWRCAN